MFNGRVYSRMQDFFGAKSHKALTYLIGLNIIFDLAAVSFWFAFPATQWSIYRLGFSIVGTEAALAAALFSLTLFGLLKKQKWAPILAIAVALTQRIFGTYVFYPSPAIFVSLGWSLIIIFFAYIETKTINQKRT